MPEFNINASNTVNELNKINQKVLQVEGALRTSNNNNIASMTSLSGAIGQTTVTEDAFSASIGANTAATVNNNTSVMASSAQLAVLSSQLLTATGIITAYTAAWNMSTMAISANSMSLLSNSATTMLNTMGKIQGTAAIVSNSMVTDLNTVSTMLNTIGVQANTISSVAHTGALMLNSAASLAATAMTIANTEALMLNSLTTVATTTTVMASTAALVLNSAALAINTGMLIANSIMTLVSAICNLANFGALYLVVKKLNEQKEMLTAVNKLIKENFKNTLISAIANLGNWLATLLYNGTLKKEIGLTQNQTKAQNLLNGALAAAAILKNPLIGAMTVAGAALAQGLISGQKTEPIEIEMTGSEESTTREVSSQEMLTAAETNKSSSSMGGFIGGVGGDGESFAGGFLGGTSSSSKSNGEFAILTDKETDFSKTSTIKGGASIKKVPKMATGGVVTRPTFAMIGEGRYDEAVIPLGNSPQMSTMKNDIANAVVQSILAVQNMSRASGAESEQLILNMDGQKVAQILLPKLAIEQKRRSGYKVV